ncbi:YidH family protein [Cupriavidus sp. CP313]
MHRPRWQQEGSEPDYRFSLANERTFLAWIRTALALSAGGLLLQQLASRVPSPGSTFWLALALGVAAPLLCIGAYMRWKAIEIAMRNGRSLPHGYGIPVLVS